MRPSPPRRHYSDDVRLTFNGSIIETGTESYGLARTRVRQSGKPIKPMPSPDGHRMCDHTVRH
jgi:hypothetical protein